MAKSLKECLTKAERIGILTDAEMAFVLKRAAELGNEKQAITEIHQQRLKEYEAIKEPTAADKVVIQTTNENVAMAAYTEEVRNATKPVSPEKKTFEEARAAKEKEITGATGPETIAAAAIRIKATGQVFQGALHYAAGEAAIKAGLLPEEGIAPLIDSGYVTSTGRFVGSEEAFRIAKESGQKNVDLKAGAEDARLAGEDIKGNTNIVAGEVSPGKADVDIEAVRSFLVSPQQQGHTVRPTTEQQIQTAMDLGTRLIALSGVGNVKMRDTFGMYQGAHNRNFETTFTAKYDANLTALVNEMAKEAGRTGQDSITIARVLEAGEDSPNARPGVDVEFKNPIPIERIDDIVRFLRDKGIDGFTLMPSGYDVTTGNPRTFTGLRFQEIPEFSQQPHAKKHAVLVELADELAKIDEVENVTHQLYDTLVLTSQDYDKNGLLKRTSGTVRAAAWADRAFDATNPQAARERREARAAEAAKEPSVKPGSAEEVTSQELETAAALVAAGTASAPVATIVYQDIYRRVVSLMQQNRAALEGMKFSAATDETLRSEKLLRALGELDALLKYVPAEVRGKVGGFFQLAKVGIGEKALAKFFGERVRTLERELEQFLKKQYLGEIRELFDKSKAVTNGGIRKGKMDADAQAFVDSAVRYSKMDASEVAAEMVSLDSKIATATDDEARINAERDLATLGLFGDLAHRTANQLYSAYRRLGDVVEAGKDAWKQQAQEIKARNDERAAQLIASIGASDAPGVITAKQKVEGFGGIVETFAAEHLSLLQFLDYVIPGLSFTEEMKTAARQTEGARTDFLLRSTERLHNAVQGATGARHFGSFGMASQRLMKRAVIDFNGKSMKVSKLEAIQHLLTWDQADGKEKMGKAGYTDAVIAQFRTLASDSESQSVIEFLRKEYEASYKLINPVYRQNYGVDLPKIDFYAPSRYEHAAASPEIAPFGGMVNASGTTAPFMHQRVGHEAKPVQANAITVYLQHMNDVAHFIYDAQFLREIRGTLMRTDVKDAITQKFGDKIWNDVYRWLQVIGKSANGKAGSLASMDYLIDSIVTMKAVAALSLNPKSIAMQADSAMRVVMERPMKEIAGALLDLPKLADAIAIAFNSPAVQRRLRLGASADVRYVMEKSEFLPTAFMRLARMGMLPLSWGDALLTSVSAGISYRGAFIEAKKMGMLDAAAKEYALDKMDSSIYRFSQPAGVFNRSLTENTGNAWFRAFMLFMSDPRLKTAIILEQVQNIKQGKNVGTAVRGIIAIEIMAVVAQTIVNAYRDLFTDADEEDLWTTEGYARAMLSAPLAGLLGIGAVIEGGLSWLMENQFLKSNRDPFGETTERISQLPKHVEHFFNPDDPQDFLKALNELARTSTLLTSIFAPPIAPIPATVSALTNFLRPIAGAVKNAEN